MVTSVREDPQTGFEEHVIDDADLLANLEEEAELKGRLRRLAKVRKAIEERVEYLLERPVEDGDIVRCGPFRLEGRRRQGGGFEVPPWNAVVVSRRLVED